MSGVCIKIQHRFSGQAMVIIEIRTLCTVCLCLRVPSWYIIGIVMGGSGRNDCLYHGYHLSETKCSEMNRTRDLVQNISKYVASFMEILPTAWIKEVLPVLGTIFCPPPTQVVHLRGSNR